MEVSEYLAAFTKQYPPAVVLGWLDRACQLRPAVVGDAIIDEYLFCNALGKSSKDPVLAVQAQTLEAYAGGALAVANHLAGLCQNVQLITQLGEIDRRAEFVCGALLPNVAAQITTQAGAPTLCKRRIVDRYSGNKLIEIYEMGEGGAPQPAGDIITPALANCDLILAADFGHGFVTDAVIKQLWASGVFMAVNAQSNAGNRGFNPISKYRRADYVCLANHEIDQEIRQRGGDDIAKLLEVTARVACPRWTVTRGKWGTLHYDMPAKKFYEAPALASRVVDRVGAGDALFAVTALLAKAGVPWDVLAFIGNVAGACLVEHLGNKEPLTRAMLEAHIKELL